MASDGPPADAVAAARLETLVERARETRGRATRSWCLRNIRLSYDAERLSPPAARNFESGRGLTGAGERWPEIDVISAMLAAPRGYGAAAELGIRRATGDYVLLLNDDVTVSHSSIRVLAAHLIARPAAGAVGCRLVDAEGNLQEAGAAVFRDGGAVQFSKTWGSANPLFRHRRPERRTTTMGLLASF